MLEGVIINFGAESRLWNKNHSVPPRNLLLLFSFVFVFSFTSMHAVILCWHFLAQMGMWETGKAE